MRIRRAEERDLPSILAIERICFPQDVAFPKSMLLFLIREAISLVAEENGDERVTGFVMGAANEGWGKAITLDVHPLHRREGVGRALMEALESEFLAAGATSSQLEVSEDNEAAIALYSGLGYTKAALLMDYYGPGKNAFLMYKRLRGSVPTSRDRYHKTYIDTQ